MNSQKLSIKHLGIVTAVLIPPIVVYLTAVFVFWESNPSAWTEFARLITALLGLISSGLSVCINRGMQ